MKKWIVMAMILSCGYMMRAQENTLVEYKTTIIGNRVPGDTITVQIKLHVQPGWYIYAPTPVNKAQDVQVMSLKLNPLPDVLRACEQLQMPTPHLNKNHEVFEGTDNLFYQRFVIGSNVSAGEYILRAQLKYQACNKSICYPPITEKIDIPFVVSP